MATTHELLARSKSVYAKYEKYVVKRPGDGDDADGKRVDGAYGAAYAALLDRVNTLMQVREGEGGGRAGPASSCTAAAGVGRPLCVCVLTGPPRMRSACSLTHTLVRKRMKCGRRRTGRARPP